MEPILRTCSDITYLECPAESLRIASERDALDLVALCGEHLTERLLLDGDCLHSDFFELKTGLAGAVLLKLSNYHIRTAAVLPPERVGSGRFAEFVHETNTGNQFRVFTDVAEAVSWLLR
ncbi:MAG: DUF4180 domain-containing protein [Bellilinea sp.]